MNYNRIGVLLPVGDLKRSVGFYEQVMGFRFRGYWDRKSRRAVRDWEELTAKPTYTEVSVAGANIGLLVVDHVQPIHAPGALRLGVDELEATRQQIVTQGAHASEPELTPWGWRQFTVTDPDGHCWQIYDELMQTGESVCSSES